MTTSDPIRTSQRRYLNVISFLTPFQSPGCGPMMRQDGPLARTARGDRMNRRQFIKLLGGTAAVWPLKVRAQRAIKLIAYFAPARNQHLVDAFNKGLRDLSYVDGKNITVQYRFADEQGQALDAVAAQVVELAPDVIVVVGVAAAAQAKRATTIIPIIFAPAGDPVRTGLVPSLGSPNGNLTGVSLYASELNQKRLEIFKEAVPSIHHVGTLWNANNPFQTQYWLDTRSAADRIGLTARPMMAKGLGDLRQQCCGFAEGQLADLQEVA